MINPDHLRPVSYEIAPFEEWQSFFRRALFSRHGRTAFNEMHLLQGSSDIPLSPNGAKEIERKAQNLTGLGIGKIVSSAMLRAQETAAIFASHVGVSQDTSIALPSLNEYNFGILEKQSIKELEADQQHTRWLKSPYTVAQNEGFPQNATDFMQFLSNVNKGMREVMMIPVEKDKKVLVVSHAMVTRAIRFLALLSKHGISTLTPDTLKQYERSFFYEDPDTQSQFIKISHDVFALTPALELKPFS